MVFNRQLVNAVRMYKPRFITMHDGWLHRVCLSVGGTVIGDSNAYINYRQHQNNAVGMHELSPKEKLQKMKKNERKFSQLAGEMIAGYSNEMSQNSIDFLTKVRDYEKGDFIMKLRLAFINTGCHVSSKDRIKLLAKILSGTL
jgi:rhamnosyltransferase